MIPACIRIGWLMRALLPIGVYSDRASRYGLNYHHVGGGPGYDLGATVYPETPLGRVSIAVFVTSSSGPRAQDREASVLARLLG